MLVIVGDRYWLMLVTGLDTTKLSLLPLALSGYLPVAYPHGQSLTWRT